MKIFRVGDNYSEESEILCGADFHSLPSERAFLFTDGNVFRLYGKELRVVFPQAPMYVMKAGEENKTKETLFALLSAMARAKLHRADTLVCVGGGVVGDVGGLASALYMRGIRCKQVPTTLLAMVDSSVGGKTAIDFDGVKNLVGVFRQPEQVLIDPTFLKTLPEREVRCGLGEIVKHAALDGGLFDKLIQNRNRLADLDFLAEIIPDNVALKADVVRRDAHEAGLRKCLNLGHTTAHAVELTTRLSHGECVLVGILFESVLAEKYCVCDGAYLKELRSLARSVLKEVPLIPVSAAESAILDKKNSGGDAVSFTVPTKRGAYEFLEIPFSEYRKEFSRIREVL